MLRVNLGGVNAHLAQLARGYPVDAWALNGQLKPLSGAKN